MMRLVVGIVAAAQLLAGCSVLRAEDKPLTETQKIEALIKHVEELKDAKFVRNDQEYDAKTAATFLRAKWKNDMEAIKTAKDFIEKAASVSSSSGKPYLIRFKDRDVKSGEYLAEELKKLDKPAAEKRVVGDIRPVS